ncbi:MAG: hypothetical protein C3F18_07690 [Nitrosomonadales bacterium]|nr:MAG: hypothetical protein C3F18_07690 [Nitrosomonadales bacterium]
MTDLKDSSIYAGDINLNVANNSHTITFRFIHERLAGQAASVLEVGCNTGYFGAALQSYGHTVFGVELSETAAEQARQRLHEVFTGTVEAYLATDAYRGQRFDCIVFGDVLEHLRDPQGVLHALCERLNPDGIVVASVPNITHAAVRAMLMSDRWQYAERGILDNTHLRFFDKVGFVRLLDGAGLKVEALATARVPPEATGVPYEPDVLANIAPQICDVGAEVFQYVVVAHAGYNNERFLSPPLRVLILWHQGPWPLGDIRLWNPLMAWSERHGGEVRARTMSDFRDCDIAWAQIIVVQREASPYLLHSIMLWRSEGKAVVFDIDDLLLDVPEFLQASRHYRMARPLIVTALRRANMVTTTTARLAVELAPLAAQTSVIPNCSMYWQDVIGREQGTAGLIKLLVASTDTVRLDFIVPALRRALEDASLNVELVAIGPTGKYLQEAGLAVTHVPTMSYSEFLAFVASQGNAIGIIPLDASRFSACKSPIKFIDYARCGVPSICSDVPPYNDVVENDVNGILVANDENTWYLQIKRLATDSALRARLAAAVQELAKAQYSLAAAADLWQQTLQQALRHAREHPVKPETPLMWLLRRMGHVLRLSLSPSNYIKAVRVLAREGLSGIWKRIR